MIGSDVWGYYSFVPAASHHILSLKGENMGASERERTEGEEALKITMLPSSLVFGSPVSQLSATLPFFPLPRYLLIWSVPQSRRRWEMLRRTVVFSHVSRILFIPISLGSSQTTWRRCQPSDMQWKGKKNKDRGDRVKTVVVVVLMRDRGRGVEKEGRAAQQWRSWWETRSWA